MNINQNIYDTFLEIAKKQFNSIKFKKELENVEKIDENHCTKKISIEEINKILKECDKKIELLNIKNIRIFLDGNSEIILKAIIEAIRLNFNIEICMYDFCYGQNLLITDKISKICADLRIEIKINLVNMIKNSEIIKTMDEFDKNIVIGNPNLYNKLSKLSDKIELNSYGIFEIYSDSDEFEIVKDKIYEITEYNQYFIEDYSDLSFDDAVKFIKKDGYKFATIILSKDKNKLQVLKDEIHSKYVIVNENPFKKVKFEYDF